MKNISVAIIVLALLTGCDFSKSVKKDFTTGLLTKGDGLTCDNVYLSVNDEETKETTFIYGQKFKMNFDNISGFRKENSNVFPGMQIVVISKEGDTVLQANDLYGEYTNGLDLSPLQLSSAVTAASPISSGNEFTLFVKIWDKKEKGTFTGEVDFKVIPNEHIIVDANKITYNEVYLFSKERGVVIPNNRIKSDENTYVIFEGISGLKEENGIVFPGLSLIARDNENNVILNYNDLFFDYSESGLPVTDVHARVSANFILNTSEIKNPLSFEITIWDKKSDARITTKTELFSE